MSKFYESNVWGGGAGTGDEITWLGPSLGRCKRDTNPRKPAAKRSDKCFGTVVRWNEERGFGFLQIDGSSSEGSDVFLHTVELQRSGIARVGRGDRLAFIVVPGKNGKPSAVEVEEVRA
jgi:cold shock protein